VSGDSAEGCNRKATSTSQRGLRSLRSNPRVLHRKEKNIYRINRLPLRSSGFTCVDVVGTGLQTGLRGTVFSKVRNLGYRTRLAVKTETNDLFRQLKLRAPCPLARVMFIAIRIRRSGTWSRKTARSGYHKSAKHQCFAALGEFLRRAGTTMRSHSRWAVFGWDAQFSSAMS
jgi:hypothetical protein